MKSFIYSLLREDSAANHFVYLLQGVAVAFAIVVVTVSYVHLADPVARDGYTTFMMMLLGGQSVVTVAKGYNKRSEGAGKAVADTPKDEPKV